MANLKNKTTKNKNLKIRLLNELEREYVCYCDLSLSGAMDLFDSEYDEIQEIKKILKTIISKELIKLKELDLIFSKFVVLSNVYDYILSARLCGDNNVIKDDKIISCLKVLRLEN